MDYTGQCVYLRNEESYSQDQVCAILRENYCSNVTGCSKIIQPLDGCCPICGEFNVAINNYSIATQLRQVKRVLVTNGTVS